MVVTEEEAAANRSADAQEERTGCTSPRTSATWHGPAAPPFDGLLGRHRSAPHAPSCAKLFPRRGEPIWSDGRPKPLPTPLRCIHGTTYPYPTSLSVNGPAGGMEYPMITFNGPRPEEDDTYPERSKYRLIGVVIHEVGHNWFPTIINSDERQWTWMDEGLNTFVQSIAGAEWSRTYPPRQGREHRAVHDQRKTSSHHDELRIHSSVWKQCLRSRMPL